MPSQSKSVVFNGYAAKDKSGRLEKFSYEPRALGPKDVEIKIEACGICGSDIHTITSGWGPCDYPCIPGHEIVGKVSAVGKDCKYKLGDRVGVGAQVLACQECDICKDGGDNMCSKMVMTYNDKYKDGKKSFGGYADYVRVHHDWAFALPENMSMTEVASLLCAGTTVYAPLKRHTKSGMKVAVRGIGGLGHIAIMIASKMELDVTAISSSDSKKAQSKELGADHFVASNNEKELEAVKGTFDVLLNTASGGEELTEQLLGLLKPRGKLISIGMPEGKISFGPASVSMGQKSVVGSLIGSTEEVKEMLAFCSKHEIKPWVETMPMSKCNEGIEKVESNKVKYRVVLQN